MDEGGEEGALLLLVISHAADSFPEAQAQELAGELLKVRDVRAQHAWLHASSDSSNSNHSSSSSFVF